MSEEKKVEEQLAAQEVQPKHASPLESGNDDFAGPSAQGDDEGAMKLEQAVAAEEALESALQRARADAAYVLRRAQEDLAHARKFAIESFAKDLLPFKDSLEAALRVQTSDADSVRAGLEIALKQLNTALEKNGMVEICPHPDEKFDPKMHRAVSTIEGDEAEQRVLGMERKGYVIDGRVIRPATVTVKRSA